MKVRPNTNARVVFKGEYGDSLTVQYDNRGEPYREGIDMELQMQGDKFTNVFLDTCEVAKLRDVLLEICPLKK